MPRTLVVIGGAGQIGRQVAKTFLEAGWRVTMVRRGAGEALPPHPLLTTIVGDRDDPATLDRAVGTGVDAVIDVVAVTREHARQLLAVQSRVGVFAVVSSAGVYCDDAGRTLGEPGFSGLPVPVRETHPAVSPGTHGYAARKAAVEQTLLQEMTAPVTIVRPAAVYGPGSSLPREWWVLKRLLDGRKVIPLAFAGESRFHTSATANLAALLRAAVERPGTRILNAVDPSAPTAVEIGEAIAAAAGFAPRFLRLPGPPVDGVGASPWSLAHPFVLDMSAAGALGYQPATTYASFVRPTCRWLIEATRQRPWQDAFPELKHMAAASWFDYAREDALPR